MKKNLLLILFLFVTIILFAQVPTNQDCLGSIPICQNTYSNINSYVGTGNYLNEIDNISSCLASGEKNDVWYTFTVTSSGSLSFLITPVNLNDDYDWAVYNLTNANCSDIANNSSLEVSCNYSGTPGTTGPNGGSGSQYEASIPVTVGQTYVINVSNYSSTADGYSINFGGSTATMFDNVAPHIQSVQTPIACGSNNITFTFSENILCSTIQTCDFKLTGPGGPYTLAGISGAACNAGGQQENTFNVTISPPITTSGNFYLHLMPFQTCGSVTDLCGNTAPPDSLLFVIGGVSAHITSHTGDTCGSHSGTAHVNASGGTGGYTYYWDTNPVQTTANAQNLSAGVYHVTVTANGCSGIDSVTIQSIGNMQIATSSVADTCNIGHGSATAIILSGTGNFTYLWNTLPVQTTPIATNLPSGAYTVTVTTGPCSLTSTVNVISIGSITTSTTATTEVCGDGSGTATVIATGGLSSFSYLWSTFPAQTTPIALGLTSGNYYVTVTSGGCTKLDSVNITSVGSLTITAISKTNEVCGIHNGSASVSATGGSSTGNFLYNWNTNPPSNASAITSIGAGTYSVTVSDGTCNDVDSVVIANTGSITTSTISTTEVCGNGTGTASVSAQGGLNYFNYQWGTNPAQSTSTAVGLTSGHYHVTVTSGGCLKIDSVNISSIGSLSINVMPKTNEVCGLHNGTASAIVFGGTGSGHFLYHWNNTTSDSSKITGLTSGTYSVTVSEGTCKDIDSVVIINTGSLTIVNPSYRAATCGNNNGSATVHPSGGTGVDAFSYFWNTNPMQDSSSAINLGPGSYIVTVSQGTCQDTAHFNIVNIPGPTTTTSSTMETCTLANGTATVYAIGGSGQYNYMWSTNPVQTTATAVQLDGGYYFVTVFDGVCHIVDSVNIFEYDLFNGTLYPEADHCEQNKGSAKVVITGTSAPCNYVWTTNPVQTTPMAINLASGNYSVTVNDGVCTRIFTTTVSKVSGPTAEFTSSPSDLTELNSTCYFLDQSSGNPDSWAWVIGDTSHTAISQNTEYTFPDTGTFRIILTVKDNYNCISSISKEVHVREVSTFYVANAFTPNKDGVNDLWGPEAVSIENESYSIVLYNRWGNLVFSSNDMAKKWDGSFKGKKAQPGVYTYIVHLKPKDSGEREYVGSVTLLH